MTTVKEFVLDLDTQFSIEDFLAVSHERNRQVSFAQAAKEVIADRRDQIVDFIVRTGKRIYGWNTGFGANQGLSVSDDDLLQLQDNIVASHAMGFGEEFSQETVRLAMLLRARSLAKGNSGVRPVVIDALINFLNADITPVVHSVATVSASGDLAPLACVARALKGDGEVYYRGRKMKAKTALRRAGLEPLVLREKEGLALTNGSQFSNALLIEAVPRMENLLKNHIIATAMTAQVMLASTDPFKAELHELRPHPGAQWVGQKMWMLLQDSPMREAQVHTGEVQDPYRLRGASQILGPLHDMLVAARKAATLEANSVTDNPIPLFDKDGKFKELVSGGHFHGASLAYHLFNLSQVAAKISALVHTSCQRYVDPTRNRGLGPHAQWPGMTDDPAMQKLQSISSGMMIVEYAAAALSKVVRKLCYPIHLDSPSTAAGQEDDVSLAAIIGVDLHRAIPLAEDAVGLELAFAGQAAAIRKHMEFFPSRLQSPGGQATPFRYYWDKAQRMLNPAGEAVLASIHKIFPPVKLDRDMEKQLRALGRAVESGVFVRAVEDALNLHPVAAPPLAPTLPEAEARLLDRGAPDFTG